MIALVASSVFLTVLLSSTHGFETSLKFGANNESYVLMTADLSPASEEITVCSWIKRMSDHRKDWQYWLSYVTKNNAWEMALTDVGQFYFLQDLTRNFNPSSRTIDVWHHLCASWSFANHTTFVYVDGELVASKKTWPNRKLSSPGSLMLGQFHTGLGGEKIEEDAFFGGELYDFNIYSKQLSSADVGDIFNQSRCSSFSQSFEDDILLSWEDVLKEERHGDVTESLLDCPTVWNILYNEKFFTKKINQDILDDLEKVREILREFEGHHVDEELIQHLKKHHDIESDY